MTEPGTMSDAALIEKMLENATLSAAITTRTDLPEHERLGIYGQLQAAGDRYRVELESRLAAARPAGDQVTISVIDEIRAERMRQQGSEGWTLEHDDQHTNGELAFAAGSYAIDAGTQSLRGAAPTYEPPARWLWSSVWWKPSDRRRNLIKAGALIVAEIERLDRLATPAPVGPGSEPDHG